MTPHHIEDARVAVKDAISSLATIQGLREGQLDKIVLSTLEEVKADI